MALWLSEVLWRSKSLQQVRAHQRISCLVVDIAGTASQPFCLQYLKSQCTQSRWHNQQRGIDAQVTPLLILEGDHCLKDLIETVSV